MKKTYAVIRTLILAVTVCLFLGSAAPVQASEYMGEWCWQSNNYYFRLAVTHMGDGHYLVNGYGYDGSSYSDGAVHGSAEVIGNNIDLSMTGTLSNNANLTYMALEALLEPVFYSGTANIVGEVYDPINDVSYTITNRETLVGIPCQ